MPLPGCVRVKQHVEEWFHDAGDVALLYDVAEPGGGQHLQRARLLLQAVQNNKHGPATTNIDLNNKHGPATTNTDLQQQTWTCNNKHGPATTNMDMSATANTDLQ